MRFTLGAIFFAAANAQSASTTTIQGLSSAIQACSVPLSQQLQYNSACSQQISVIASAMQGTDPTALNTFCASSCLGILSAGYTQVGTCMQAYTSKLTADLTADGVANPASVASSMMASYKMMPEAFNLMCSRNEKGEFCMPLFSRMGTDLAASSGNMSRVCDVYYNTGCCLTALDRLYATVAVNVSFVSSITRLCPSFTSFAPPNCLAYGQSAVVLTITIPLTGLNCATFSAQSPEFRTEFETALKNDLAAKGISPSFTTVKSITNVNGVCTATLVVRAGSDSATRDFTTAAATAGTATLTLSNQVLSTVPTIATGSVTAGAVTVNEATIQAQTVGPMRNSGSSVAPGFVIVGTALAMFLA